MLLAYNERATQKWADAKQHAERGLQALDKMPKADNVSEADFAKQKTQLAGLLNSVAGFSALQLKDYPEAEKYLRPAVEGDPNNVENVYPLALAYLTATPADEVNGLFFIARAANLVSDPKGKDVDHQVRSQPLHAVSRHRPGLGRLAGSNQDHAAAARGLCHYQVRPPTPQQQAAELVKTKKPEEMSFAEWELVLSVGTQADQDTVWNALKGKNLQMAEVQVITASPTSWASQPAWTT